MSPHQILVGFLILYPVAIWGVFKLWWVSRGKFRTLLVKCSLLVGSTLYLFGGLEFYFMNSFAVSDGFGQTKMHQNWIEKYGSFPNNSLGLRDEEHEYLDKPALYVVGDSFSAGHGINDHRDRYANVLEQKLAGDWDLVLLAKGGWGTEKQLEVYSEISNQRDDREGVIIWQYYLNDIEGSGKAVGLSGPPIHFAAPRILRPLVDNYHFANFLYWGVFRTVYSAKLGEQYLAYLNQCFDDARSWEHHRQQLQRVVNLRKREELTTVEELPARRKLIVIVYPNLKNISGTRALSDKVASFFESQNVAVVNMADLLGGFEASDITVNALDGHANEMANRLLAEHLYRNYFEQSSERGHPSN